MPTIDESAQFSKANILELKKIEVTYLDKIQLYKAYIPFIKNGGLFIPTKKQYQFGEHVLLSIELFNRAKEILIEGPIVWMTPANAQGGGEAGIGVQLVGAEGEALGKTIKTILVNLLNSDKKTNTM